MVLWDHYHEGDHTMPQKGQAQHDRIEQIKIQVPVSLKVKLDTLRTEGTTASGLIRNLLNQHFNQCHEGRKA
jgi:hypothetical protein